MNPDTIAGAVIALVSACVGYAMGLSKPYFDQWQRRKHQKAQQKVTP